MKSKEEELAKKAIEEERARRKKAGETPELLISLPSEGSHSDGLKFAAGSEPDAEYNVWNFAQFLKAHFKKPDKTSDFHINPDIEKNENKYRIPFDKLNQTEGRIEIGYYKEPRCFEVAVEKGRPLFKVGTDDAGDLHRMVDAIVASLKKFKFPEPHEVVVYESSPTAKQIIEDYCKKIGVQCSFNNQPAQNEASLKAADDKSTERPTRRP